MLFRSLYPRLVAVGVAMLGDVEVARDLAQETMARGHRKWDAVSSADSPEAWLRRVMINLVIDHLRRRRVEARALERLASGAVALADTQADLQLAGMLAVLSERQRAVVTLFYVDDLPIATIAEVLAIAPGTVKALMCSPISSSSAGPTINSTTNTRTSAPHPCAAPIDWPCELGGVPGRDARPNRRAAGPGRPAAASRG